MSESHERGNVPEWDIADRMRKALRDSGLSVQGMADYLGVSRNAVGTWINGKVAPRTQTVRLWALRTGVSYEWLTEGGPLEPPTSPNSPDRGPATSEYADTSDERDNRALPFVHMTSQEAA